MSRNQIEVVLHGLFAFFEKPDGWICARLPKVELHHAGIEFQNGGLPHEIQESGTVRLTGVKTDGEARLLEIRQGVSVNHICTFETGTPSAQEAFFEVILPPPQQITTEKLVPMTNLIRVIRGKMLNPEMREFADKFTLTYEADGEPRLANISIIKSVRVISGPKQDHGHQHRSDAFRAGVLHIDGVDATWNGEIPLPLFRVDPPGCSVSSGTRGGGG